MDQIFNIFTLVVLGLLSGLFIHKYLVDDPVRMSSSLAIAAAAFVGSAWVIIEKINSSYLYWAVILWLLGFAAAYWVKNEQFLRRDVSRPLPEISRAPGQAGGGHTAVIIFTHGEPPAYDPAPWIETMLEFDHDQVPFIPRLFRPFFFHNVRREYLELGGSSHNRVHQHIFLSLQKAMPEVIAAGTRFYLSFLDSCPRPDEMAVRAVNEGASRILLVPIFLTESSHTQAGQKMVEAIQPDRYLVTVHRTTPLWNSELFKTMYVGRAEPYIKGVDRSRVGVLLVGHGQPAAWDQIYPTQTEQENSFREDVRRQFVQAGYVPENVALAWMEFKDPLAPVVAKKLAANGIEKLLVIPISISADSIHSDIQIPEAVKQARLPETVQVINLGAWGDDPILVQVLKEKIEAALI